MTTGFVFDEVFLSHRTGAGHPECAERLSATTAHLNTLPWYGELARLDALPAQQEFIETSHSAAYLARARQTCVAGSAFLDSMDTAVSEDSFDIALKAAGAAIALADGVMTEKSATASRWCARPGTMPSMSRPWGSASSTTWPSWRATCRRATAWTRS